MRLGKGTRKIEISFLNDHYVPNKADCNFFLHHAQLTGTSARKTFFSQSKLPASHKKILFVTPTSKVSADVAGKQHVVYGSGISDGDRHNHDDLPILLAGSAGGRIKTGRHIQYKNGTPLCNLYLWMMPQMGAADGCRRKTVWRQQWRAEYLRERGLTCVAQMNGKKILLVKNDE